MFDPVRAFDAPAQSGKIGIQSLDRGLELVRLVARKHLLSLIGAREPERAEGPRNGTTGDRHQLQRRGAGRVGTASRARWRPAVPSGRHAKPRLRLDLGRPVGLQWVRLLMGSRSMVTAVSALVLGSVGAMPGASTATGVNGAAASGAFASTLAADALRRRRISS